MRLIGRHSIARLVMFAVGVVTMEADDRVTAVPSDAGSLAATAVCATDRAGRTDVFTQRTGHTTVPSANTWVGRHAEFEEYIKRAEVVRMVPIGSGVTHPYRAWFAPGGPVESISWKPDTPGERYAPEIAAYELDKLLGLNMVPVTVERQIDGVLGAAKMWVQPTQSFDEWGVVPTPPIAYRERWERQLIRAYMFENLIYNADRNLANWLVGPCWHLILIDHNRAFTPLKVMAHELTKIDRGLWNQMQQLDRRMLKMAVGAWLSDFDIRILLERRALMERKICTLIEARGEETVFIESCRSWAEIPGLPGAGPTRRSHEIGKAPDTPGSRSGKRTATANDDHDVR